MSQRFKSFLALIALAAALAYSAWQNQGTKNNQSAAESSDFDFYVLALSWSPTFCVEQSGEDDKEQCSTGRPFAFVVHGLWPQNDRGFPSNCQSDFGSRIDGGIANKMLDIMPSRGLVFHQWRKHGTCSGLSPQDYFSFTREAKNKITVPDQFMKLADYKTIAPIEVERAFITANPTLQQNAIAVTCSKRYLKEVRICMDKSLTFRPCPEVDAKSCRAAKTVMPPTRG